MSTGLNVELLYVFVVLLFVVVVEVEDENVVVVVGGVNLLSSTLMLATPGILLFFFWVRRSLCLCIKGWPMTKAGDRLPRSFIYSAKSLVVTWCLMISWR